MFGTLPQRGAGSFGGLAGADAMCQSDAAQAGLPGHYVAWLSTATMNAIDRLNGARGWIRTDGVPFVDLPADLVAGRVLSPIMVDAAGRPLPTPNPYLATGTIPAGTTGATCSDYTSASGTLTVGGQNATRDLWTDEPAVIGDCTGSIGFYCFGIDRSDALAITPAPGRRAFVSTPWQPGSGLGDADAHCRADASSQALSGTFIAFLGTTTSTPMSRLTLTGAPWVRLDGIPLAPTAAALFMGPRIAPLNVAIDGSYLGPSEQVWTGYSLVSTAKTCSDWSAASNGITGSYTTTVELSFDLPGLGNGSVPCSSTTVRLYCFEP